MTVATPAAGVLPTRKWKNPTESRCTHCHVMVAYLRPGIWWHRGSDEIYEECRDPGTKEKLGDFVVEDGDLVMQRVFAHLDAADKMSSIVDAADERHRGWRLLREHLAANGLKSREIDRTMAELLRRE